MKITTSILASVLALTPMTSAWACASCGCSLNSDWSAQGLASSGGWSADVRVDYLDQNQLRQGTGTISGVAASQATDTQTGQPAEVEQYTRNIYATGVVDYSNGSKWGVNVSIPTIDRAHSTLGNGSDGVTFDPANGAYTSQAFGLGDVKVVGRYFGLLDDKNLGFELGLKLPTGGTQQTSSGGSAQAVDPGLQLGTGTTDAIIGLYYFDSFNHDWGYFAQATFQSAFAASKMAGGTYRPGNNLSASVGLRYMGFDHVTPTLQVNGRVVNTDGGTAADTFSTGGRLVYLTPGALIPINDQLSTTVNVQVPVYQNLNGIQLAPRYIASIALHYDF